MRMIVNFHKVKSNFYKLRFEFVVWWTYENLEKREWRWLWSTHLWESYLCFFCVYLKDI